MSPDEEAMLRRATEEIQEFRKEWADSIRVGIEDELAKLESEGYDPTKGRGRGPAWAEGG
jgi:hypothetical protein